MRLLSARCNVIFPRMNPQKNTASCMPRQNQENKAKMILGVTGSFGSGKTTVAGMFKPYGASVIDADALAHKCLKPASSAYALILRTFGSGVLQRPGVIDRRKLAGLVFGSKTSLKKLNAIIHPLVIAEIRKKINSSRAKLIVLDAPLLVEARANNLADKLIVVTLSRAEQLRRLQKKNKIIKQEILQRISAQIPLAKKVRIADFVIDNSGTKAQTKKQVEDVVISLALSEG